MPNELIYKNPVGKLKTIVSVDGKKGTSGNALTLKPNRIEDITVVTDTIKYEGLVGDKNYTVTGTLNKIEGFTVTPVTTKTETKRADSSGNGEWTIDFGITPGMLAYDAQYVVYEEAVSEDNLIDSDCDGVPESKQTVEHKNRNDRSQTFYTKKNGGLKTKVSIDGKKGTPGNALVIKTDNIGNVTTVSDTIN